MSNNWGWQGFPSPNKAGAKGKAKVPAWVDPRTLGMTRADMQERDVAALHTLQAGRPLKPPGR